MQDELDMAARYRVQGSGGVAWYLLGYDREERGRAYAERHGIEDA